MNFLYIYSIINTQYMLNLERSENILFEFFKYLSYKSYAFCLFAIINLFYYRFKNFLQNWIDGTFGSMLYL